MLTSALLMDLKTRLALSQDLILLSLDINKALDTLWWSYLMTVLCHYGFGSPFLSWIAMLYDTLHKLNLNITVLNRLSFLSVGASDKLSAFPAFFLSWLQNPRIHSDSTGIDVAGSSNKILFFAYDMTPTSPRISLPICYPCQILLLHSWDFAFILPRLRQLNQLKYHHIVVLWIHREYTLQSTR